MPVSKTQREARTLRGLWRAQKRYWRDRRELRVENKRDRIREFWDKIGEDHPNHPNKREQKDRTQRKVARNLPLFACLLAGIAWFLYLLATEGMLHF